MVQEFQVLKCYKCCTFQVHQIKKSKKWECKLCGDKQSIKRNYGIGTSKECRQHVQNLNKLAAENYFHKRNSSSEYEDTCEDPPERIQLSSYWTKLTDVSNSEIDRNPCDPEYTQCDGNESEIFLDCKLKNSINPEGSQIYIQDSRKSDKQTEQSNIGNFGENNINKISNNNTTHGKSKWSFYLESDASSEVEVKKIKKEIMFCQNGDNLDDILNL